MRQELELLSDPLHHFRCDAEIKVSGKERDDISFQEIEFFPLEARTLERTLCRQHNISWTLDKKQFALEGLQHTLDSNPSSPL
jgi:hypothetical protein